MILQVMNLRELGGLTFLVVLLNKKRFSTSRQRGLTYPLPGPRDPGSPKLRMVSCNLNTLLFGGDNYTHPQSRHLTTFGEPGSLAARVCTFEDDDFLGGGFKYFLFSSLFGEDSHFD